MGQAIDEAGNVWEIDNAGNPVRIITPAQQQGRVFSLPPNPKDMRQEERLATNDALSAADRAADNARADRQLELAEQAAAREAAKGAAGSEAQQKARENAEAKLRAANAIRRQLGQMREIYERSFKGRGPIQSLREMLPTDDAQEFKAIARAMRADLKPLIRGPGEGTFTEGDQALLDQLIPDPRYFDAYNEQTFQELENRVTDTLQQFGGDEVAGNADQRADNEVPDPTTGADLKPPPAPDESAFPPENGGDATAATGKTRRLRDTRMSAQIDAMINAGASKAMIDAVLTQQKFDPITPAEWSAISGWRKDNPGQKYSGADIGREEDLTLLQRAASSPLGSGLAHYANMATAGTVGALAGEQGQGALDAMAALNPGASMAGGLAGGVTGALGAEAALVARAPAALARFAPRIADTLYGGALGFNAAREGEGLQGAALGAGAGLAGGWLGQRAMSGTGRAMRGVQDVNVGYLRGQGIPLTVGQTVGGSGRVGAAVKNVEDAMTSIPGVSSIVNARRMEGLQGFNEAAMRQAGAPADIPVTAAGAEGMEQLRQGIGPAYDAALGGAQINTNDPNFAAALQEVVEAANGIPNVNGAREAAAAALDNRLMGATHPATGIMPGRGFQEAYRGLGRTVRERAGGDYGHEVGQVMRQGQNVLAEALDAQNPGALAAFRNANTVNRNANVIADALGKAKNQQDELFTPAQINMADATSARRLEGPMASAAGDRPFFDLARAGQEVLPSKLPDSGTATRGLVGAGLVGGIGGAGIGSAFGDPGSGAQTGLGLTLLLAAGGSKPAQKAMVSLLADRPDLLARLGNKFVNNAQTGGWLGAGALAPLTVGPLAAPIFQFS